MLHRGNFKNSALFGIFLAQFMIFLCGFLYVSFLSCFSTQTWKWAEFRGEILRPQGGSFFANDRIPFERNRRTLCTNHRKRIMPLSRYYWKEEVLFFSMFRTQYIYPRVFVAEHYGLRNNYSCWTIDLASWHKHSFPNHFLCNWYLDLDDCFSKTLKINQNTATEFYFVQYPRRISIFPAAAWMRLRDNIAKPNQWNIWGKSVYDKLCKFLSMTDGRIHFRCLCRGTAGKTYDVVHSQPFLHSTYMYTVPKNATTMLRKMNLSRSGSTLKSNIFCRLHPPPKKKKILPNTIFWYGNQKLCFIHVILHLIFRGGGGEKSNHR
jgi:hypothetical protein